MRFHWFLPSLPKADKQAASKLSRIMRRVLKLAGPTWVYSPLRRLIQFGCLGLFLWLFVYVCWPYSAEPARAWHGWLPVEVDVQTGQTTVVSDQPHVDLPAPGTALHVADTSQDEPRYLGRFELIGGTEEELLLVPAEPLEPARLDELTTSFGPWALSEQKPGQWPSHYADDLKAKEKLPAEGFLAIDPLVSISTAIASRTWVWSLWAAGGILLICLLIPRGFCGYACPMGTLIDLFDWAVGKRVKLLRPAKVGWYRNLKYYVLLATLTASFFGLLISGFVAAIPVLTRGMAFILSPLEMGITRGWHQVPQMNAGHLWSITLFCLILGLGILRPRFWCRYVCPSGALFSVANLLRVTDRKVDASCIGCGRCVKVCPFDAIKEDFTTRGTDCTFCQTCGGACPTKSIKFTLRWDRTGLKLPDDLPAEEGDLKRRDFLVTAAGVSVSVGVGWILARQIGRSGTGQYASGAKPIVRPPGSVPEEEFLQLCIRCGECFRACPNNVLQPALTPRIDDLWTPQVTADWSGCEPSCNNCGQVCPTGAIRALPLDEKRVARMGLAVLNKDTCLPYAGLEDCQLCIDECVATGYDAIEFAQVGTEADAFGQPIEGTGFLAPVVIPHKCVGCGLCQTRCYAINAKQKGLLQKSAIVVEAGEGKEDRLVSRSYVELREQESRQREERRRKLIEESGSEGNYLPDFLN